jgi:hypothetical protein
LLVLEGGFIYDFHGTSPIRDLKDRDSLKLIPGRI